MQTQGEVKIAAPRAKVWAALQDPAILKTAIPGCTEIARTSDTEMTAVIAAHIGMVRATFNAILTFSDVKPPNSMTVTASGIAGSVGSANGTADVVVKEVNGDTIVRYAVRGGVAGKLDQVGDRLIDQTAREVAERFFSNFGEVVSDNPIARVEHAVGHAVEVAEEAVEEAAGAVLEAGREAEQEVEGAAIRGVLGGPMMWGLLAIVAIAALLIFFR
jgi:carbon monoxide dehydrogenase subunit G